jgi:hypothetical protein
MATTATEGQMNQPAYFVYGRCWSCGGSFTFNPHRVPSVPILPNGEIGEGGTRQPICRGCATLVNRNRERDGLPLWDTSDEAYGIVERLPE